MSARPLQVKPDRKVGADRRQVAAEGGRVASLLQFRPPAVFHLVEVGVDFVQRLEFGEQAERGLFAHARHAGNVVGRVTDDGFVIHHLLRAHAELAGLHVCGGDEGFVVARHVDGDALIHELQEVAIAGDDLHAQPLRGGLTRNCA